MAVTTSVLSGTIADVVGDLNPKYLARVVLVIEANTEGSLLRDTSGDRLLAGAKRVDVDRSTGAYSVTLPRTNSADIIPADDRLYRATLIYPSGHPGRGNVTVTSGWFELTADASLSDSDIWQGIEVTAVSSAVYASLTEMLAEAETIIADSEANLAAQIDISNIEVSDDVVEALVKNTGGAGPKTSAALSATLVSRASDADDNTVGIGNDALGILTTGERNVAIGARALAANTTGHANVAIGADALANNNGVTNTAVGWQAMMNHVTGACNVAIGPLAMRDHISGDDNTAVGSNALTENEVGASNTAIGTWALTKSLADSNTAVGAFSLFENTTGFSNTAVGAGALRDNVTGNNNTALGAAALQTSTGSNCTGLGSNALTASTGDNNTGVGAEALFDNTTGQNNVALGASALHENATGSNNTALGTSSLAANTAGINNTAVGTSALTATTGSSNTALGANALASCTTGEQNVALGSDAGLTANPTVVGGYNTFIGGASGAHGSDVSFAVTLGYGATVGARAVAIGYGVQARAAGAVAIGHDSSGNVATTTTPDDFVLGTSQHQVKISNNVTGAGSAALGANCPAVTTTAPYTWLKMKAGDGSNIFVPAWA